MSNAMNSGSVDAMNENDTILHKIWKTRSGDKVQLEFVEQIQNPFTSTSSTGINLLYLANKSDARFTSRGQRAWLTGTPEDVFPLFGLNANHINNNWEIDTRLEKEFVLLNILNPEVIGQASPDGEPIRARVQVTESLEPNSYQLEDEEGRCKRRGAEGDAILHEGKKIFVDRHVVPCPGEEAAESTFLKPDPANATSEAVKALDPFQDVKGLEV